MGQFTSFAKLMLVRILGYTLSAAIGIFIGVSLVVRFMLNPTNHFWRPEISEDPPACLTDPSLGTHNYVQTKDVKLHYVEKGDRDKPLMLCIHGFPEFWYSWRHVLKEFSSDYWVVALDMRGYGDSDKPEGREHYKLSCLTEDITECIKAFGREKCTLVAHDWGGIVAWSFLLREPHMVDSYIIMNSVHPIACRQLLYYSVEQLKKSWYVFFFQNPILPEICCQKDNMEFIEQELRRKSTASIPEQEIEAYKYTFRKPGAFTWPINYYRANFLLEEQIEVVKGLAMRRDFPPGLLLFGENDIYLSKETQELSVNMVTNASLVYIKEANHFIPQDNPKAVIKEMILFLSRIRSKKDRHS